VPRSRTRGLARFRPRRLGLRARITLLFALGALLLSVVLAGTTYVTTRGALLRQRESAIVRQTFIDAKVMREGLKVANANPAELMASVQSVGTVQITVVNGKIVPSNPLVGNNVLPESLVERVNVGVPARMRFDFDGQTQLGVGIPLVGVGAAYYEIVSLKELTNTLRSVAVALIGAAALTTVLGALLGIWASRRVVRPLAEAANAAEAIAGGRLDTRLEAVDDRDLDLLITAFNEMASALQSRVERDARFASDVSHELRSPLMTLSAAVEVLQGRREDLAERAQAALDLLSSEVTRFSGLVEDLLEISRFDAGAVKLDLERVNVGELVHAAVAVSGYEHDVPVLVLDESAGDAVIRADKRRLARVIANLLDNARNYAGGATRVTIERPDGADGDGVVIAVEDAGPGVGPDDRLHIFERFNRGTGAGNRGLSEGSGLGLALVQEHVKLHRGRVWVEDRPDGAEGARFVVELPVVTP